jgi:hypothetical protein
MLVLFTWKSRISCRFLHPLQVGHDSRISPISGASLAPEIAKKINPLH